MKKAPTLNDLRNGVPKGGLLDPGLREVHPMNFGKLKQDLFHGARIFSNSSPTSVSFGKKR
jgi:hypothetical protein